MNENIQLVDISKIETEVDTDLIKEDLSKRFDKIKMIQDDVKLKVYFKKHHDSPGGNVRYEINVAIETPKKRFISDKTDYSVFEAISTAMDSVEKETRKYFDKKKVEGINNQRVAAE